MIFLNQLSSKRFLLILITFFYGCSAPQQYGVGKEVSLRVSGQYAKDYRAQGNEPFWSLEVDNGTVVFNPLHGDLIAATIIQKAEIPGGYEYTAEAGDDLFAVKILNQVCVDNMAGMPYPDTVIVTINDKQLHGCGGAPENLLQDVQWEVDTLDGAGIITGSRITVEFGEKRVTGHSSCNHYMVDYQLTGEDLTIAEPASTRKACRIDIMEQEKKFLRMLQNVTGFEVVSDDRIKLTTRDHSNITLQKKTQMPHNIEFLSFWKFAP